MKALSLIFMSILLVIMIIALSYFATRLATWSKNIDIAERYLKDQKRMTDSMEKHIKSPVIIFNSFKDSHDYYFSQVMSHVYKMDE